MPGQVSHSRQPVPPGAPGCGSLLGRDGAVYVFAGAGTSDLGVLIWGLGAGISDRDV